MVYAALMAAAAAAAPCAEETTSSDIRTAVDRALQAKEEVDPEAFDAAVAASTEVVRCLGMTPADADLAAYYRIRAVERFWRVAGGQVDATTLGWMRSARGAEPDHELVVYPERHPFHAAYGSTPPEGPRAPLPEPATGTLAVDGRPRTDAPTDRPWLFQRLVHGAVATTAVVPAGGSAPTYPVRGPELPPPLPEPAQRRSPVGPLVGGAGVALLATGGGLWYGANAGFHTWCPERHCPPSFFEDQVRPQRDAGVGLVVAGAVAGAAGVVVHLASGRGRRATVADPSGANDPLQTGTQGDEQ